MVASVNRFFTLDHMADLELQLTAAAAAQHHKRVLCYIPLAQEKNKIQNSKYVPTECVLL